MFCICKTDPDWLQTVRNLPADVQVNFWRKGKNDLTLKRGSWLYFNQRRTKLIVGRGVLVDYTILTIENAWARYGIGNGVSSLAELKDRARTALGIEEENTKIGCIVLSDLEFLTTETNYPVTEQEYSKNIVGPKYLQDHEIPGLHNRFQPGNKSERAYSLDEEPPKLYAEGESTYSYHTEKVSSEIQKPDENASVIMAINAVRAGFCSRTFTVQPHANLSMFTTSP